MIGYRLLYRMLFHIKMTCFFFVVVFPLYMRYISPPFIPLSIILTFLNHFGCRCLLFLVIYVVCLPISSKFNSCIRHQLCFALFSLLYHFKGNLFVVWINVPFGIFAIIIVDWVSAFYLIILQFTMVYDSFHLFLWIIPLIFRNNCIELKFHSIYI